MNLLKSKKIIILLVLSAVVLAGLLFVFRPRPVTGVLSITPAKTVRAGIVASTTTNADILTYAPKDQSDIDDLTALLSGVSVRRAFRPGDNTAIAYSGGETLYHISLDDGDASISFNTVEGYVYFGSNRYKVDEKDKEVLADGLNNICAEWKQY